LGAGQVQGAQSSHRQPGRAKAGALCLGSANEAGASGEAKYYCNIAILQEYYGIIWLQQAGAMLV
jgi:hypothetical protein